MKAGHRQVNRDQRPATLLSRSVLDGMTGPPERRDMWWYIGAFLILVAMVAVILVLARIATRWYGDR
jgi:hypothetical protein